MTQEGKTSFTCLGKGRLIFLVFCSLFPHRTSYTRTVSNHGCLFVVIPGELFSQEEMDEMLTALADRENNLIYYKDLICQLTIDPD